MGLLFCVLWLRSNGYHYTHHNITSRLGALCTQDQYLPSPASLSMSLPSNGFPTLPTDQTASAKIRPVYRYVQYALLLSRTLLEVLGCSYYVLGCDFNDSASRSTWENIFRTVIVKKKHTVPNLIVGVGKKSGDLPARAHLREHTFRYQRYRACNL